MNVAPLITMLPHAAAVRKIPDIGWPLVESAKLGDRLQITGEELAEAINLVPGSTILDIAGGNGNATLAFARRGCRVTSTDYVGALLDNRTEIWTSEGLSVDFVAANAHFLPFENGEFDAVVSTFGLTCSARQNQSALELIRVCRSGGKIALTNWTPDGFIGQLLKALAKHVPPHDGANTAGLWGDEVWIDQTFGAVASSVLTRKKDFNFCYQTPNHFVEFCRKFFGPVRKAFIAVGGPGQKALEDNILEIVADFNIAEDDAMCAPSRYTELVVTKA